MKFSRPFLIMLQACLIAGLLLVGLASAEGLQRSSHPLPGADVEETWVEEIKTPGLSGPANHFDGTLSIVEDVRQIRMPSACCFPSSAGPQSICRLSWIVPLRI